VTVTPAASSWPIALERDVHPFSLVRARLAGRDLVVWRDVDQAIHVWEDRCPHRSVRLSAGRNLGDCLEGAYHGWRFGRDGGLTSIPVGHVADNASVSAHVLASRTAGGLVWACLEPKAAAEGRGVRPGEVLLRPLPFGIPEVRVAEATAAIEGARFIVTASDDRHCLLFGFAEQRLDETELDTARRWNDVLTALRRRLETGASS